METRLVKINNMEDCKKDMEEAGELIKAGELVAFPTETVYGLGGNGLLPDAAKKIYAAKGRPSDNPLILHVCDMQMVESLVKEIPDNARRAMEHFWPGPMTVILQKADQVPDCVTGGLDTGSDPYAGSSSCIRADQKIRSADRQHQVRIHLGVQVRQKQNMSWKIFMERFR